MQKSFISACNIFTENILYMFIYVGDIFQANLIFQIQHLKKIYIYMLEINKASVFGKVFLF